MHRSIRTAMMSMICLAAVSMFGSGCATAPPPSTEVNVVHARGHKPHPHAVWVKGHHAYRHGKSVWVPGHWKRP